MSIAWRTIQQQNFTELSKLLDFLEIEEALHHRILKRPTFPLNLPKRLAEKIEKNNLNDPLFKQFVPLTDETQISTGYKSDPLAEFSFRKEKKLLQKYAQRALILTTSACAMHCRFCFRQNFPYETETKNFEKELEILRQTPSLSEVILSGGDPLSLSDETLENLLQNLSKIPHIKLIRFHTRFPLGIPERISENFLRILAAVPKQVIFVSHSNHAREWDPDIFAALKTIQRLGIPTLNQTVLLKDINDDKQSLKNLFETLISHGIMPYYLHQLDQVNGTAHFEVPEEKGKALIQELIQELPGYAIPRYVREIPGHLSKTPL